MAVSQQLVTKMLTDVTARQGKTVDQLWPVIYDDVRNLAMHYLRSERKDHTLQPTALVHEAFLKLVDQTEVTWRDRAHFIGITARAMRQILVDYARQHGAQKRGGDRNKITLHDNLAVTDTKALDLLMLDESLEKLNQIEPTKARVVELRFFGGLTIEETAEVMSISHATVHRHWRFARAWLQREMNAGDPHDP